MISKARTIWSAASVAIAAGSTLGQSALDQGTISRQRNKLDHSSIASSTDGWLNDSQTPRFWSWPIGPLSEDLNHPNMQRWVHIKLWPDITTTSGGYTLDYTWMDNKAKDIADDIVARLNSGGNDAIADGEYAIGFQDLRFVHLHDHEDDHLDTTNDVVVAGPTTGPWSSHLHNATSPARASLWNSNGVALTDTAMEYLADQIVTEVLAHIDFPGGSFPAPLRAIFDEERGRQHGTNSYDNLAEMNSIVQDTSRTSSESLYGNYDLWTSTSPATAYLAMMTVPLKSIYLWDVPITSPATLYSPHVPINASGITPNFDHEFFPLYNHYNSVLSTSIDGTIEAGMSHILSDSVAWGSPKWSNYGTSAYYSDSYPRQSGGREGALNPDWYPHEGYGWSQTAFLGSGGMQSPVLYPHSDYMDRELLPDFEVDPKPTEMELAASADQRAADAWLRFSRMQLDHIIFSFDDLTSPNFQSPRHIAPWVTRVGTTVYRYGLGSVNDVTSKENVRNIVALCKAKGVNEILFWGNPDNNANGYECDGETSASAQYNWDATNDVLSQVYEYSLSSVDSLSASDIRSLEFSEEHTHDFTPTVSGGTTSASFEAEFDIGTISTLGDKYTFVCETIDGGGPWADATYTLEIYNYKSSTYQTVTDTPIEKLSKSTRKVVFNDTDSDDYSNEWDREFDDDGVTGVDLVYDRKLIQMWDQFEIPIGANALSWYTQSNKMKFRITASHPTESIDPGETRDPLRIDLVQLYESECENDNISAPPEAIYGDFTDDGLIDTQDFIRFMQEMSQSNSSELDLNHDGVVDAQDLRTLIELSNIE